MSEKDDIEEVLRARIVADALTGGDLDALIELSDALEASGTPEKTTKKTGKSVRLIKGGE
jgi:hypothetical protein